MTIGELRELLETKYDSDDTIYFDFGNGLEEVECDDFNEMFLICDRRKMEEW